MKILYKIKNQLDNNIGNNENCPFAKLNMKDFKPLNSALNVSKPYMTVPNLNMNMTNHWRNSILCHNKIYGEKRTIIITMALR